MPLYEYLCEACGRTSEVLQRLADPPLEACPHCGGKVKKQVSAPAFHLKGSGWYATDYGKKGGGESPKAGSSAHKSDSGSGASDGSGGSDAASPSTSDARADAKSDTKAGPKSESKGGDAKGGDAAS